MINKLEKVVIIDVLITQIDEQLFKREDRFFDLPPRDEWYVEDNLNIEGLKGWIHRILIHDWISKKDLKLRDIGYDPETTCYYEDFLSIDQKDEMYKLNDDGLIWWVDEDDKDYSEMNEFLEDLYTHSIMKLGRTFQLGWSYETIGKDYVNEE